jgi:hypothetical protein
MGCAEYGVQPTALQPSIEVIISCTHDEHESLKGK